MSPFFSSSLPPRKGSSSFASPTNPSLSSLSLIAFFLVVEQVVTSSGEKVASLLFLFLFLLSVSLSLFLLSRCSSSSGGITFFVVVVFFLSWEKNDASCPSFHLIRPSPLTLLPPPSASFELTMERNDHFVFPPPPLRLISLL